MPGRRSKRTKTAASTQLDDLPAELNLANIDWQHEPTIDVTPLSNRAPRHLANIPLSIQETATGQHKSDKHFAYIAETALRISTTCWCLSQPGHGHIIQAHQASDIPFTAIIACDTDQSCRNTLQERYHVPVIFGKLSVMLNFLSSDRVPVVQGYYAHCDLPSTTSEITKQLSLHENIITQLQQRAKLEIFVLELPHSLATNLYKALLLRLGEHGWVLYEKHLSSSEHFSDRICTTMDLVIGLNFSYVQTRILSVLDPLSPTPVVPKSMSPKILVEFDTEHFALPHIGNLFTV
jgi:hypothetical protein